MTSSVKKLFAGMSAVAIALTQAGSVFAAYSDVPAGVWFEEAVEAFTDAGYLDAAQTRFRGGDNANRAEFIKLVVELNGGILSTPPAVPSFGDVATGAWYYGYMEEAAKEGWLKGDNDCYVSGLTPCMARPGANINRAEAAALIVRAFALESTEDAPVFVDVPEGQWYTEVMQTAADHCVLQGDDATGRARPSDPMNRAEMVVMLNRVDMGLTYGVDCARGGVVEAGIKDVTALSEDSIEVEFTVAVDETAAAVAASYAISGDADIDVESVTVVDETTVELTLAEATDADGDYTVTVTDMEAADGDTFSDSMDFSGYTEIVLGDGTLEVSIASSSPDGDTVPKGALGVVMLTLDLEASCDDDVTIEEITVLHDGYGATADIDGLYVAVDGGRISRKRSLDSSDQTANLRLTTPLTIAACKTKTIDIVADIAAAATATTGGEHNLAVEMKTDFQGNAKEVQGSFPMSGNTFTIAAVSSGTVTFDYKNVSPSSVDVGTSKVKLGKFEISTNSTEDQALYSLTLEQTGSASEGDLTNLRLARTDGTVLSNTVATTAGDYVTFKFDPPRIILAGDTLVVDLLGDVVGGAADTVLFNLEETSDLFAVGSLYGKGKSGQLFGSPVTETAEPTTVSNQVTLTAGQLTIEVDGPAQRKYTEDSNDATLAKVIITPGAEAVDIRNLYISIRGTSSIGAALASIPAVLEDVTLRNTKTGRSISATTFESTTSGYQDYRFDDFLVEKQETFELQVDFITGVVTGSQFIVYVNADDAAAVSPTGISAVRAEGVTTGKILTDIRPGVVVAGSTHLIVAPEVTVAVRSIGATDTTVRKAQNVNFLRFDVTPGEASAILITGATFDSDSGSLLNAQNYALWVDSDGDTVVDTILEKGAAASSAAGEITFDTLNGGKGWSIAAQDTVIFEVHGDIASNPPGDDLQLQFKTASSKPVIEMQEEDTGSSIAATSITWPTPASSKVYSIASQGNLFVTKNADIRSRQLLAGTLADSVLQLELLSQYEDIDVDTIRIAATGATAAAVSQLELFKGNETTSFLTLSPCSSTVLDTLGTTFCGNLSNETLVVKKSTPIIITVRPRINGDELGAASQSGVTFWTASGGILATGLQSSTQLTFNNGSGGASGEVVFGNKTGAANASVSGNPNDIVLAKFSSIVNKLPSQALPTGGDKEIARFEFTAPTNTNTASTGMKSATLSGIVFTVSSTNIEFVGNSFQMYRFGTPGTKVTCTTTAPGTGTGAFKVTCLDNASLDTEVKGGQSATFSLEADITNNDVVSATTSSLQVSLTNFAERTLQAFGTASTSSNINWTDSSRYFYWVENVDTTVFSTLMSE